jgi:beta-N-acetylhexosaminidase
LPSNHEFCSVPKALIVGVAGTELNAAESNFLKAADPLGFILFARNISTPDQVRTLVADMRSCVGREDSPVLIDQEGGRVARLGPPHWRAVPAAALFGELACSDPDAAQQAVRLNAQLIGAELAALGITVDCAPVADVPAPGADPIISDRAFSSDEAIVADLAAAFCKGLASVGVLPVIKHIPGHGRAGMDSHKGLPRVDATKDDLTAQDFAPFVALARLKEPEPWAMTAHVVFESFDKKLPATMSSIVIEDVVRKAIGFDGIVISDDLSMGALDGSFEDRAAGALAAGCDLVLHCNGKLDEMEAVARGTKRLEAGTAGTKTETRLARSLGRVKGLSQEFDAAAAQNELSVLMAPVLRNKQ